MDNYRQVYQNVYSEIASRFTNNNNRYNQNKYYKVLHKRTIIERLLKVYALLIATINIKWKNYTYVNL